MKILLLLLTLTWGAPAGETVALILVNNDAEISLGKTAAKKARSEDVRRFAQMMVDHHSASNSELKASGLKKEKTADVKALKQKAKVEADRLGGLDAARFDSAYIDQQIEAHRALLGALDRALGDRGALGDAAPLIEKTRGVVATHLEEATRIRGNLGR